MDYPVLGLSNILCLPAKPQKRYTFLILFNKCFFWLQVMILALRQKNPRIPEEKIEGLRLKQR